MEVYFLKFSDDHNDFTIFQHAFSTTIKNFSEMSGLETNSSLQNGSKTQSLEGWGC